MKRFHEAIPFQTMPDRLFAGLCATAAVMLTAMLAGLATMMATAGADAGARFAQTVGPLPALGLLAVAAIFAVHALRTAATRDV